MTNDHAGEEERKKKRASNEPITYRLDESVRGKATGPSTYVRGPAGQ